MLTNHLMLSLLAILLCLPLVLGTPVDIKKFGTKAGIHFEHIGTITLSTSEWNLLVYYDLNTYWSETASLINGTRSLLGLCKILTLNTSCLNIIDHFENMEGELQLDNRLLRSKRGAINIVGNVAHSLFGILDSEYANQMSETILKVKENEAYLLHLLQHQTSVVDSTINIMRQNQLVTKARFEHLEQEITLYSKEITNVNKALLQVHLSQLFNSGALQLELIANNLLKMQSLIFNTLMDTQHGKISPSLLTPEQLQKAVDQINLHSPSSLKIPVTDKNELLQLFKLMKVKGRLTHQHVVFKITLPLVENEDFKTFYMTPIPNTSNGTMVAITPCSAVLGIAASREQYIVLTESELSSCDVVQQDVFLCSNVQMRYNYGSERCACEINLFNNKTTPACILEKTTTKWAPLNKRNQWIYATSSPSQATAVCHREIIPIHLKGSGLLTLNPECVLKHEFVTISGRQTIFSTVRSSYTSLGKISDMSLLTASTQSMNSKQSNATKLDAMYANNIRDLITLQRSLEEHDIIELPNKLRSHQEHSYAIGYLALSFSLFALIILLLNYKANRSARKTLPATSIEAHAENYELQSCRNEHNRMTPLPMPRQQRHSFIIDV